MNIDKANKIINDFGGLMEKYDYMSKFYDVSLLPYSKKDIYDAIVMACKVTQEDSQRELLKIGHQSLTHFQENIGDQPIVGIPDLNEVNIEAMSTEDLLSFIKSGDEERYNALEKEALAEHSNFLEAIN